MLKVRWLKLKAQMLDRLGARDAALAAYRSAVAIGPPDPALMRSVASRLAAAGDRAGYGALLDRLVQCFPSDLNALGELGEHLYAGGDYPRALPVFTRLRARRQGDPRVLTVLGEIHLKLNAPDQARECFMELLTRARDRNALRWLFKIGQLYLIHRRPEEAVRTYRSILSAIPGEPTAQLALIRLVYLGGDLDEAGRIFAKGEGSDGPDDLASRVRRALRLRDAALKELILEGRATDPPERVTITTADGTLHAKVPPEFRRQVKPVYSLDEQRDLRRDVIALYLREGQPERALFHLGHLRPRDEMEQAVTGAQRGVALGRTGDLEGAGRQLDAVDVSRMPGRSPADLELLYQTGTMLLHCGRAPRALEALKRVLLFDVGYRDAAALVERLRAAHTGERPREADADRTRALSPAAGSSPGDTGSRLLGKYTLGEIIRTGFMGELFHGTDASLGRKVVLRRLPPAWMRDPSLRERFAREARGATRLSHPHLATILDVLEPEGELWLVSEWVPGTEATQLSRPGRPLGADLVAALGSQAAAALATAHAAGVLHRDLKGSDFHVHLESRRLVVLDVGLSGVSNTLEVAPAEYLQRRCDFMPPEFILGERVDERGDIYSLGILLYRLATGRFPFEDQDVHARMFRYLETAIVPPSQLAPGLSAQLDKVIMGCLERDRDRRYPKALAVAAELDRVREASGA